MGPSTFVPSTYSSTFTFTRVWRLKGQFLASKTQLQSLSCGIVGKKFDTRLSPVDTILPRPSHRTYALHARIPRLECIHEMHEEREIFLFMATKTKVKKKMLRLSAVRNNPVIANRGKLSLISHKFLYL